jgi:superfamily II helicase
MPYSTQRRPNRAGQSMRAYHAAPSRRGGSRSKFNKQYINPDRFIKAAQPAADVVEYVPTHTFADFELHQLLKTNIADKGYVIPSPIQDQTIPHGLNGKDIVGIANTGTGKTAAFALPTLQRLLDEPFARALIIAPTRELAEQIEQECRSIAKGSGLHRAVLIGGSSMRDQLRDLQTIPSIVIGTPGRIKDHIERGTLDLSGFNIVTLDEVDHRYPLYPGQIVRRTPIILFLRYYGPEDPRAHQYVHPGSCFRIGQNRRDQRHG